MNSAGRRIRTTLPVRRGWMQALIVFLLMALVIPSLLAPRTVHASPSKAAVVPPFVVTFTTQNFGGALLRADPIKLDDPAHATFSITDGSQLWYAVDVDASPTSLTPTAADPADDIKGTALLQAGLLQPTELIPLNGELSEELKLATSFTAPDQQLRITLDPFDFKAVGLDLVGVLLNYVGMVEPELQVGLLQPGELGLMVAAIEKFKGTQDLINDTISMGHAMAEGQPYLSKAVKAATDLYDLFSDASLREQLAEILVKAVARTLPTNAVLKTIASYPMKSLLSLASIVSFFEEYFIEAGVFVYHQAQLPTILLQSVKALPVLTLALGTEGQCGPGSQTTEPFILTNTGKASDGSDAPIDISWTATVVSTGDKISIAPTSGVIAPGETATIVTSGTNVLLGDSVTITVTGNFEGGTATISDTCHEPV